MKTDKLYYGAAYYDEYMPYERVETDFKLMREAGFNLIRIAESTWSTWEKREGEFDFTSLDRMLDGAEKYGLSVIVGTPTYAVPTWLVKLDPKVLTVNHNGQNLYGPRQNMDIVNPTYRKYAGRMIEKLTEHVADRPCVVGYQIDNETKAYDTCSEYAQKDFVGRLKKKYPDPDAFNHEFGLDYWSNRVDDWDCFPDIRQTINMSLAAEYEKYQRQIVNEFFEWQAGLIGKYKREDQFLTHNFDYDWIDQSLGYHPDIDQYAAARHLTVAGCDIYHQCQDNLTGKEIVMGGNIARSLKGTEQPNYLVLETNAQGLTAWLSYPGQLRLNAYAHIANGANCVEYWHWHSIHNAIETYWKGVLSHDLTPGQTYRECSVIGNEFARIGKHIKNMKKSNRVGVLLSNEALTGMKQFPTKSAGSHSYNVVMRWLTDVLYDMNIEYDMMGVADHDFSKYECVILPPLYSATEELLKELDEYVAGGGNLIAAYRSGFSNEILKVYPDTQPHILNRALGIRYDQFTYPEGVTVEYGGKSSAAREWMELVTPVTAETLSPYTHHTWGKYSAVTLNSYGKGHAMYLATMFGGDTLREIYRRFFDEIGLAYDDSAPVSIRRGVNDDGNEVIFYLNYSKDEIKFTHNGESGVSLLDEKNVGKGGELCLPPWGVCIVEIRK